MKQLLPLFTLCISLTVFSQSTGNFTASDLCYNTSTNCSNIENSHQIVMPYDGKIVFTGTVNGTTSNPNPLTFSIYANIDYINFEGNNAGHNAGVVLNETGPLIEMETNGLLAGTIVNVYIGFSGFSGGYTSSGGYNIDYYVIPPTYNNDPEPNDDYTQAISTTENTFYEGHGYFNPDDINNINESEDWYKLTVPVNGTLNVTINHDNVINGYFSTSLQMYKQNNDGTVPTGIGYEESSNTNGLLLASAYCLKQGDVVFLKIAGNYNSYQMYWNMQEPLGYIDNEPNDLDSQALTINLNETKYGNIGYGITLDTNGQVLDDDTDWYKFDVVESGDATITLNASQNSVYIIDAYYEESNGTLTPIYYENVGGTYTTLNFNCTSAGTYYVKVKDYSSSSEPSGGSCAQCCSTYSISYTFSNPATYASDETEPNDDYDNAEYLPLNTNFNGQIVYRISDQVDYNDYYEIQTNYNGPLNISFANPFDGNVALYYYDGAYFSVGNINTNASNQVTSVSVDCAAEFETYYLHMYSSSCTSYQLYATNTYTSDNNEFEPNNDTANAQILQSGDNINGHLGFGSFSSFDDYDYFSIPITVSAPIEFYFDLYDDATVELRNDFSILSSITQDSNSGSISSLVYNNIEDTENYYLQISSNSCINYDLYGWSQGFTAENDLEPNNTVEEAIAINFNQDYYGRLTYYNSGTDSEDYYSFTLSETDDVEFELNAYEGLFNNAVLTVYDALNNGQVFQLNHDGTNSSRTTSITNLSSGSYYFTISGTDQTGSYGFKVTPQNTLGVNDFSFGKSITIYPVPAKNEINIVSNQSISNIRGEILDVMGKLLYSFDMEAEEKHIDITTFQSGIYFLKLETENATTTKRFVKQ
ncbi:T9SS type A sorting domain-containing protein [Flavobacteriaceae bacterium 144Ye]|nr:T9SS type A sorting domain-containing protein [Flavobacteriaceae bacterium 144Ye]